MPPIKVLYPSVHYHYYYYYCCCYYYCYCSVSLKDATRVLGRLVEGHGDGRLRDCCVSDIYIYIYIMRSQRSRALDSFQTGSGQTGSSQKRHNFTICSIPNPDTQGYVTHFGFPASVTLLPLTSVK